MSSGGKREGAGAPPKDPQMVKVPVGYKLPRWLVEWLRGQDVPAAQLIEDALRRRYKLRPPHDAELELAAVPPAPTFTERDMETAIAVPITERLRAIKIGSFSIDEGSHSKHFAVAPLCREAAAEIERSNERERQLYGECLLLADVLRDAFEVVKTIEGEEQDECDKLTGLCLSMAHALALYDERRIEPPNAKVSGGDAFPPSA